MTRPFGPGPSREDDTMEQESLFGELWEKGKLSTTPPFIWPDARIHEGSGHYTPMPSAPNLFAEADLINGLIVGPARETVRWLTELLRNGGKRRIYLVLVVFPAGPTRKEHLNAIFALCASCQGSECALEVHVLPMFRSFGTDCELSNLPPTVIQGITTKTDYTLMSVGSVGDSGCDDVFLGSCNFVFQPDDAMRAQWGTWFEYIRQRAALLTADALQIPNLVPAQGDSEATRLWEAYVMACEAKTPSTTALIVDSETGEVRTDANGNKIIPWDEGVTALDPLAQVVQQVYATGWLVTIDRATRIKPLIIPVNATFFGQQAIFKTGAAKQTQSFDLKVLDEDAGKNVEGCRQVTDLMDMLTYPLSPGNRWLSNDAKGLLDQELEARNKKGKELLLKALGGSDIKEFIAKRKDSIREDLNNMSRHLGQGDAVPNDKLNTILDEVEKRVRQALDERVTPRAVYNRIQAPNLTAKAEPENWNQPLSLLVRSAKSVRQPPADSSFYDLSFSKADFQKASDVFGDVMVASQDSKRAKKEFRKIDEINDADENSAKEKCQEVWLIIKGGQAE